MKIREWLICPDCKVSLKYNKKLFKCEECKRKFKERNGILSLSSSFESYEWSRVDLPTLLGDRGRTYRDFYDFFENNEKIFQGNILEVGADVSGISAIIKDRTKTKTVIASDIAGNILEAAIKVTPLLGKKPDFIIQCDVEHLPFRDEIFDVVIGSSVLHHTNLPASIKEISRVLKPNGFFISLREPLGNIFTKPLYSRFFGARTCKTNIYSAFQYRKELKKNKFKEIKITFYKNPRWMYPKLLDMVYYNLIKPLPHAVIERMLLGKARIIAKKGKA